MQSTNLTIPDVLEDLTKDLTKIYTTHEYDDELEIEVKSSAYFTETDFTDSLKSKKISDNTHLTIISLNVANLLSKLNSLKTMVQNVSTESNKPSLIALTETHLNELRCQGYSQSELEHLLPGYRFFHNDRKNKRGGGVGIFVFDGLANNAKIEKNECFFEEEIFESITLKIPDFPFKSSKKNLIVLTLYRQPGQENLNKFLEILEKWLEKYDKRSNEIIITGDFNLDLLKYETHSSTSEYLDLMITHELLPVITKPTRIKHSSATLIDHFFCKLTDLHSGILVSELSGSHGFTDHYPIFCIIETGRKAKVNGKQFTRKYFTHKGHRSRREGLRRENWDDFYNESDPTIVYEIFQDNYCKHYQSSITTKTVTIGQNRLPRQPWMTQDILKKIRRRDRLAKLRTRRDEYRQIRNEIVSDCRKAERSYINRKIQENVNNTKEHWKILKKIMGKMNDKSDFPSAFKNGDIWVTDMKENSEYINNYYANVGPDTNQSVGVSKKSPDHFLTKFKDRNPEQLILQEFTEDDVLEACRHINKKKSCDAYGLSQAVVINDIDIIAPMIVHIANCSLGEGICPDLSKIARVIPVYKEKGEKYLYSNYRPISLIPVLSKILEKLMYNKIFHFLVRYQIFFKSQYGFRPGHGTIHATLDLLKTIEKALQENEYAIGVFCDLSKAFDTLDHDILLRKLDHYGVRGKWHSWLKSYLSNRKQFVDINGITSSHRDITVGVPQGSILGPLLFLIYINDLPASLEKLTPVLFADDTNLVIRGDSLEQLCSALNSDLEVLSDYFRANKLKLNAGKTKVVCFRKKNKEFNVGNFLIYLDETRLLPESNATFLGINLDEHLTWEDHCNKVANKMAQNSGILNRVKNSIPIASMKILYNSLIFPHYSYCLEAWGSCQQKHLKRIKSIQKKSVRAICKSHWLAHTEPRMKSLKILKLEDQHQFQCLGLTYGMLKGYSPDIFDLAQTQLANNECHTLRSATNRPEDLRRPPFRTGQTGTSFLAHSPDLWNTLPKNLKDASSCKLFKNGLKLKILSQYVNHLSCTNPRCTDRRCHT